MRQHTNYPGNNLSEDMKFQDQAKKVFAVFARQPSTMLMVSIETGILRANICRYVAAFEKEQALFIAFRGTCPISKHRAGFYTTCIKTLQTSKVLTVSKKGGANAN